jgi:hypothetical protein
MKHLQYGTPCRNYESLSKLGALTVHRHAAILGWEWFAAQLTKATAAHLEKNEKIKKLNFPHVLFVPDFGRQEE